MKKTNTDVLTEAVDAIVEDSITLGDMLGKTGKHAEIGDFLTKGGTAKSYVKYVRAVEVGGKTRFRTSNVNSQVNLMDDLSELQLIEEPDQQDETEAKDLAKDLADVYEKVTADKSEAAAKAMPVRIQAKGANSGVKDAAFVRTHDPESNVLFVFDKSMPPTIVEKLKDLLMDAAVFAKEKFGECLLGDVQADKLLSLHTEMVKLVTQSGKAGEDLLTDPAYNEFVLFDANLFNALCFFTVPQSARDKFSAEVEHVKTLAKQQAKPVAAPKEEPDDADQDDSWISGGGTDDGPQLDAITPAKHTDQLKAEQPKAEPAKPLTLNVVNDASIGPSAMGSRQAFYSALLAAKKVCIMSPAPIETVKSMLGGLPEQAVAAITQYTGGADLAYVKVDPGKPVMMPDNPTKLNGANLYNQVVHQLSGWYIVVPGEKWSSDAKILFLFQKKSDKAVFELNSFKPDIPLHIGKLPGNKWVSEFYTEQNTLKKQGCRVLLWSTNDSKFGNTPATHASPQQKNAPDAAKPVGQPPPSDLKKRKYIAEVILQRIKNVVQNLYGHTMKIFKPIQYKDGGVMVQCAGGWHKMTEAEWKKLADNFDNFQDFSPFGGMNNIWVKKLAACFDLSTISTAQFDADDPLPEEQENAVKALHDALTEEFGSLGLDGIGFQVVAPGRKPKYDVNAAMMQGSGWQLSDSYTLAVMVPGVNPTKFFGDQAVSELDQFGGLGSQIKAILDKINKDQADKIGLALVLDNGFPD